MTTFPSEIYQVCGSYDGVAANYLDFTPDFALAGDHFIAATGLGLRPRVLAITFDDANQPETITDVTDEFVTANSLLAAE